MKYIDERSHNLDCPLRAAIYTRLSVERPDQELSSV